MNWVFWRLLICFVIKLENIQAVNYVETMMNGNNVLLLILTLNNTDLSLNFSLLSVSVTM